MALNAIAPNSVPTANMPTAGHCNARNVSSPNPPATTTTKTFGLKKPLTYSMLAGSVEACWFAIQWEPSSQSHRKFGDNLAQRPKLAAQPANHGNNNRSDSRNPHLRQLYGTKPGTVMTAVSFTCIAPITAPERNGCQGRSRGPAPVSRPAATTAHAQAAGSIMMLKISSRSLGTDAISNAAPTIPTAPSVPRPIHAMAAHIAAMDTTVNSRGMCGPSPNH